MIQQNPNIFQYTNYRLFIKDWIENKKRQNSKYSYRYYSAKSGFSSSNFLSLVVKAKRNLTSTSIGKISKGFGLKKQERSFFEDLVFMNQASSHEEKDHYYQRMLNCKSFSEYKLLEKYQYDYFSNWYNPVIREMIDFIPQPLDFEMIAASIQPPVSKKQVVDSIRLLLELGLIEEFEKGKFRKKEAVLTTGGEVRALQVTNFHKQMTKVADGALDRFSSTQRDITGIVLSMNSRKMPLIKKKIEAFRNELADMAANDTEENIVFYIQIRAFPLTKEQEEK